MQNREGIRNFIQTEILNTKTRKLTMKDEDSIVKSGLVNSMAIVEIINYLETNFGINIADGQISIDDFDSIDSIVKLVERQQ